MPDEPTLKPEDVNDIHYGFYYMMPGQKKLIEEVAKEYVELYKSRNVGVGWSIYETLTGTDLPLFVAAHPARSQAEFYELRERLEQLFGEAATELRMRVMRGVRKVEFKDGWVRPDLSYPTLQESADH